VQGNSSLIGSLASLPEQDRAKLLAGLTEAQAEELLWDWRAWARPNQIAPEGEWLTWLVLAGRGFGKTRCGSEWIRQVACGSTPLSAGSHRRIALVAETAADARDVLVEGESGILAVHPRDFRPMYEPSKRRLTWPNGASASLFNATEPDQLRGPQHDAALCDELAKWRYAQETWDMLQFGLRLGDNPKQVVTTTPRPIPVLKEIMAAPTTVVTRGTTTDNRLNLAPSFIKTIVDKYQGTRLGRQELSAEILDDVPDALWTRAGLDRDRRKADKVPPLKRVVVAVDPAAKKNEMPEDGAATGIVVAGLGEDNRGYVLEDATCRESPNGWARMAVACFDRFEGDCVVGEVNNGGEMVEATIRAVRPTAPFHEVTASRGKWTRAEPIAALYEQGRISHVGTFASLEDEMVNFGPNGMVGGVSPDRVDALVWALTELFPAMTKKVPKQGKVIHEGASKYNAHAGAYR
jgi:phage terminase large subunit-like protein